MSIYGFCDNKCKHEVYTKDEADDKSVVVSPTEPTTNEKVWIQKGKNLISPSNLLYGFSMAVDATVLSTYENGLCTGWIDVTPNTAYTLSGGNRCRFQFKNANGVITYGGNSNTNPYTFTTLADTKYVRIYVYDYYNASFAYPVLPEVQLEQNSTATVYEEYIEKAIYIKNNNGVYEEVKSTPRRTIIYNSETGSNGNVTLSESCNDFDYIEVYAERFELNMFTKISTKANYFTLHSSRIDGDSNFIVMNEYKIEGNKFTLEYSKRVNHTSYAISDDNGVYIKQVVGYKY